MDCTLYSELVEDLILVHIYIYIMFVYVCI